MNRLAMFLFAMLSSVAVAGAPIGVTPKHRAAPPEEMLKGGPLAPVSPADAPVWSRGAMLRVELDDNGAWQGVLPVDTAGELRIIPISAAGDAILLTLESEAEGRAIHLTPSTRDAVVESAEVPGFGLFTGYTVPMQRAGLWQAAVAAPAGTKSAYLAFATDGPTVLRSARVTDRTVVGNPITFRASVHASKDAPARPDAAMTMIVTTPDGDRLTVPMPSDNDGDCSAAFTPEFEGRYVIQIIARGDGFLRTAQHIVNVVPDDIDLGETASVSLLMASDVLRVSIDARDHGRLEHCRVTAQVWGSDEQGRDVPVCWVGGMTTLQVDEQGRLSLPLDLDARWMVRSGAVEPFELRQVEVRCPRTMALLSGADSIPVAMDAGLGRIEAPDIVTDAMRTAPRSDDLAFVVDVAASASSRIAGGHNLLLVHGYCAGGNPWPLSHFSGAIEVFSDPEANRSHDEFALLLKAVADTTKSAGVVAHSQGGCAALHLYTYYFSALDWAEGPRLIQSLGTPYQGTPLAGNLAILGDIFGSGCGENTDLSVDGSAVWLSGIPSAARSRVYYWTTSSQGSWCNFFSGLFLTNPEDGVIEVSRGQLPGGNSMGNTVGQCHTTGMSDPAQYQDSTRNSEMNTNAAR